MQLYSSFDLLFLDEKGHLVVTSDDFLVKMVKFPLTMNVKLSLVKSE